MNSGNKPSQTEPQPTNIGSNSGGSRNGGGSGFLFKPESSHEGSVNPEPGRVQTASGRPLGSTGPQVVRRRALWFRRLTMALFVAVCVWAGLFLAVFPWTQAWTDNFLLVSSVTLRTLALQNFVRGLVTGLGAVNVWMGIWEAVHYHEDEKGTH